MRARRAILDLDDNAAVAFTEDACGGLPLSGHGGDPFSGRGARKNAAQLAVNDIEGRQVAPHPGQQDRTLDRRGRQHRQFGGPVGRKAVGDKTLRDQVGPAVESAAARSVTGAIRSRSSSKPASTATATTGQPARKSLSSNCRRYLSISVSSSRGRSGPGDDGGDVLAGVVDGLASSCVRPPGK